MIRYEYNIYDRSGSPLRITRIHVESWGDYGWDDHLYKPQDMGMSQNPGTPGEPQVIAGIYGCSSH